MCSACADPAGPTAGALRLAARYPRAWHVLEAEGLGGVARYGLLPACRLRELAGRPPSHANRDDFEPLPLGGGAVAVLRFQQMPDARLTATLAGAYAGQPAAWRALLDGRVFFWLEEGRRDKFLRATARLRRSSRAAPAAADPLVLEFRTLDLLMAHGAACRLSRINSGSTVLGGARARRNESTFLPLAEYRSGAVAELAVRAAIDRAIPWRLLGA